YNSSTTEIGYDVAELFDTIDTVEVGDVLVASTDNKLKASDKPYQETILGVVSGSPAILFEGSTLEIAPTPGGFTEGTKPPVALAGRVPVKVTMENGSIKAGDYITSSSKPGYAMKAIKSGMVIGIALEDLNEEGKVMTFINPHYRVNPEEFLELKERVRGIEEALLSMKRDKE
ncbi:MAG: hypothetical protein ABH869_00080, partial [Candidatus Omnitrophota bacterium]